MKKQLQMGLGLVVVMGLAQGCSKEPEETVSGDDMSASLMDMVVIEDLGQVVEEDMMPLEDMGGSQTEPDMACVDTTVYEDEDGDGYGNGDAQMLCLRSGEEPPEGYGLSQGDCSEGDPLAYPDAEGVCNDNVDDDCDGEDEACPASQPDEMSVPAWDCTGDAPENVYAWARFDDGMGYFKDNGCFVFFEGKKDIFYVQRNVERASSDSSCDTINGCTCPSLNGWPSYDRRMYAFTRLDVDASECEEVSIRDHGGEDQPVSNGCRKYLYQMHHYDIPYSYIASSLEGVRQRIELFSKVEIACVEDAPHANLPYQTLVETDIVLNPDFQKK